MKIRSHIDPRASPPQPGSLLLLRPPRPSRSGRPARTSPRVASRTHMIARGRLLASRDTVSRPGLNIPRRLGSLRDFLVLAGGPTGVSRLTVRMVGAKRCRLFAVASTQAHRHQNQQRVRLHTFSLRNSRAVSPRENMSAPQPGTDMICPRTSRKIARASHPDSTRS